MDCEDPFQVTLKSLVNASVFLGEPLGIVSSHGGGASFGQRRTIILHMLVTITCPGKFQEAWSSWVAQGPGDLLNWSVMTDLQKTYLDLTLT